MKASFLCLKILFTIIDNSDETYYNKRGGGLRQKIADAIFWRCVMKKTVFIILATILIFSFSGCGKKEDIIEYDYTETDENGQTVINDSSDFAQSGKENPDEWNLSGLTDEQIDSIDWNMEAYKTYFRVEADNEVFHYWNMSECIGILKDASLVYLHEDVKVLIDAITGNQYESEITFFNGMLPAASDAMIEKPTIPDKPSDDFLYVMIKDPDSGLYMLVFDYAQYRVSYYINEDLKLIGWGKSTISSDTRYYFNNDPGYAEMVAQYFPDGLPEHSDHSH